ncbi:MAG: ankyrin repeat domain-containing protein, partial [Longimicrobiales bacterium]
MKTTKLRVLGVLGLAVLLGGAAAPPSPVADAAMRRDITAVRALLRTGADVNGAQGDGMTALHWAARHDDVELAVLLIRSKANQNALTRIGAYTPLHVAGEAGSARVVAALLKAGSNAKLITSTGVTALHLAALGGSAAATRALLDHGADMNAKEPAWGQTPLMIAASHGRTEAVKVLLKGGADHRIAARVVDLMELAATDRLGRQRRNQTLADFRTQQGAPQAWRPDPKQVQVAVRAGLAAEKQPAASTASAASEEETAGGGGGDEDVAGFTAMVGFQGGLTALLLAVREGHVPTVQALLDAGADINQPIVADNTTPLLLASIN